MTAATLATLGGQPFDGSTRHEHRDLVRRGGGDLAVEAVGVVGPTRVASLRGPAVDTTVTVDGSAGEVAPAPLTALGRLALR